ncbi:MAG: transcriptional regulator [Gammaproteobacteria bacterium]|nr:transcriptional regulator [Gammaproteobacteria bacterium]MCH9717539.1 transcriptional regulator [Gammaproteobacteria bacterium]
MTPNSKSHLEFTAVYGLNHNDAEALLVALRNIADAQGGMTELARKTHLNRQNLYSILSKKGNPRLDTFGIVLKGLGFKLTIEQDKSHAA